MMDASAYRHHTRALRFYHSVTQYTRHRPSADEPEVEALVAKSPPTLTYTDPSSDEVLRLRMANSLWTVVIHGL